VISAPAPPVALAIFVTESTPDRSIVTSVVVIDPPDAPAVHVSIAERFAASTAYAVIPADAVTWLTFVSVSRLIRLMDISDPTLITPSVPPPPLINVVNAARFASLTVNVVLVPVELAVVRLVVVARFVKSTDVSLPTEIVPPEVVPEISVNEPSIASLTVTVVEDSPVALNSAILLCDERLVRSPAILSEEPFTTLSYLKTI